MSLSVGLAGGPGLIIRMCAPVHAGKSQTPYPADQDITPDQRPSETPSPWAISGALTGFDVVFVIWT